MSKIHIGVYGIYIEADKILLIEKSRAPYTWMYDFLLECSNSYDEKIWSIS